MTDAELLTRVKTGLMITGNQFDDVLSLHIWTAKQYLKNAGVDSIKLESEASVGTILRGVSDLWNNSSGTTGFSPMFYDMATQLVLSGGEDDVL